MRTERSFIFDKRAPIQAKTIAAVWAVYSALGRTSKRPQSWPTIALPKKRKSKMAGTENGHEILNSE
jgi:hypothetical protein